MRPPLLASGKRKECAKFDVIPLTYWTKNGHLNALSRISSNGIYLIVSKHINYINKVSGQIEEGQK